MNFMEDFVKYMAFQAHTNPWCKQEHEITPLRMKYLMAIAIGMHMRKIGGCRHDLRGDGLKEYEDIKFVFFGPCNAKVKNLRLDDTEFIDLPVKPPIRGGIKAKHREMIRDTLHVFREWETETLYWLLRDLLPGYLFHNTQTLPSSSHTLTSTGELGDAFAGVTYVYSLNGIGEEEAWLVWRHTSERVTVVPR